MAAAVQRVGVQAVSLLRERDRSSKEESLLHFIKEHKAKLFLTPNHSCKTKNSTLDVHIYLTFRSWVPWCCLNSTAQQNTHKNKSCGGLSIVDTLQTGSPCRRGINLPPHPFGIRKSRSHVLPFSPGSGTGKSTRRLNIWKNTKQRICASHVQYLFTSLFPVENI